MRKPLYVLLSAFGPLRVPRSWSSVSKAAAAKHVVCSCNMLWLFYLGWVPSQWWVSMWSLGVAFGQRILTALHPSVSVSALV